MSVKQISVFLENRRGKLDEMARLLADRKIDLRALSLAEAQDFGIARLIVDDAYAAASVLKENSFIANITPVLAYAVPDEPGGLSHLLSAFTAAELNIEYMYAVLGKTSNQAYMIFRVTNSEEAESALQAQGFRPVTQEEISAV